MFIRSLFLFSLLEFKIQGLGHKAEGFGLGWRTCLVTLSMAAQNGRCRWHGFFVVMTALSF